jgi:endonuclease/exonuclease/phosphatase (EEP) superfamily protein YafD
MVKRLNISGLKLFWRTGCGLFWLGLSLFGTSVSAWYALHWWSGDRFWPVRLLNYFMPWLLVGLIPGLVMAGLARRKWVILILAAPTLVIALTFAPLFLPQSETVLAANASFKVMSYNVLYRNRNMAEMAQIIRQEQPDFLLLQEVTPSIAKALIPRLIDLYPEGKPHFAYEPNVGQAIISRYPLTSLELAHDKGRTQKVRAETPVGPIEVWNVHPNAPLSWARQYEQIAAMAEDIAAVNGPLIVGGDFNTTDQSETYRLVSRYLQNAHWEAGWSFGFSFPANSPRFSGVPILTSLVRIDHIFYSQHFLARSAHTLAESGGSDHFPVVADLSFVKG